MANALYDKGREAFLSGDITWDGDNINTILVDALNYTPNLATDQFLDPAIPVGERAITSGFITGKAVTAGVASGANSVYTAVGAAAAKEYVVIYQDTGLATTSRLIALIDTATGLPVTPNGGDITVQWDTGANKIFKL